MYIGGSLLGDYGGLQAIRPQGTTSLNTKDVFIGGHGNTHTSKIFADGSATFSGKLHVQPGSSGGATASGGADDLIVENSTNTGISILTADGNKTTSLFFGNATDSLEQQFAGITIVIRCKLALISLGRIFVLTAAMGLRRRASTARGGCWLGRRLRPQPARCYLKTTRWVPVVKAFCYWQEAGNTNQW